MSLVAPPGLTTEQNVESLLEVAEPGKPIMNAMKLESPEESTDEGSSTSDCESSSDSANLPSAQGSRSPSRRGSEANIGAHIENIPSVGSVGHHSGQCTRCCFFPKGRCSNGAACNFCHYDHDRIRRKRGSTKATSAENSTEMHEEIEMPQTNSVETALPEVSADAYKKYIEPATEMAFTRSALRAKGAAVMGHMALCTPEPSVSGLPAPESMQATASALSMPCSNYSASLSMPAPQCAPRSKPSVPAEPAEGPDAKMLARTSAGRPVKVWLAEGAHPKKKLDEGIPAKKRPAFPDFAGKEKQLDPDIPAKKRVPTFLLEKSPSILNHLGQVLPKMPAVQEAR